MSRKQTLVSVNVCVFCGSRNPETPTPSCAHGKTAQVQGEAAQLAARLWLALQAAESLRAEFKTAKDLAVKAGTATEDTCPRVLSPGSNVSFLQDREIVVRDELRPVRLA